MLDNLKKESAKEASAIDTEMERDLSLLADKHEPQLLEVLRYGLLGGGKRIRPFLTLMAAALCENSSPPPYFLAVAFEYLHAATLMHDDIIDQSDMRRGKAAVHKKFGIVAAILAGDFLLAHSMEIVGTHTGQRGLEIFNRATKGMVDGEFWQLRNADLLSLGEEDYRAAVMRKTGYLITGSCQIGGLFAGASEAQLEALRCYGEGLGFAFQVVDDLLDYLGNPETTGKEIGNDLREGKMTLPLILAMKNREGAERERLLKILQNNEYRRSREAFTETCVLLRTSGGFELARHQAEAAVKKGVQGLDIFTDSSCERVKKILTALGHFVLQREK